ncbi:T9SS type A sorting domain-containing protein, partial [bacterium]|nr:T9SS type A sorting domain-containing protein [candidate division CSSED10-310 bacterium]
YQNYPNPFNSSTVISYTLAENWDYVSLSIYSLLGERVSDIVNSPQKSGAYSIEWDGKNNSGELVSSGIYLYRLKIGNQSLMKKLLFIK